MGLLTRRIIQCYYVTDESIGLYEGVGDGRVMPLLRSFIVFSFFGLSTYRAYGAGSVLIYRGFYLECDLS